MTHRDEDEEIINTALDTLAWQRREIDRLKAALAQAADNLARGADLYDCPGLQEAEKLARAALGERQ